MLYKEMNNNFSLNINPTASSGARSDLNKWIEQILTIKMN